jgi:PAS domain S-box-containing protein
VNAAPLTEPEASQFPRTLVVYATAGILATGFLLAAIGVGPLYRLLVEQQNQHLITQVDSLSEAVHQYLNRIADIAVQVSSRTKAREALEEYNDGRIQLADLRDFSIPILADALKHNATILGISRLDARGNLVIEVGAPVAPPHRPIRADVAQPATILGPIDSAHGPTLIVYAPILDRNRRAVGADIVAFDFAELGKILGDYSTNNPSHRLYLSKSTDGKIEWLFSAPNEHRTDDMRLTLDKAISYARHRAEPELTGILAAVELPEMDNTVAYRLLADLDWLLSIHVDRNVLYRPIYREVVTYITVLALIALVGSILSYLFLRPLSHKLSALTINLSKEIRERQQAERDLSVRVIQQATVAELGRLALSGIEIGALLDEAVKETAVVLNVEFCKLLELTANKQSLLLRAGVGWNRGLVGNALISLGLNSQAGYTLRSSEPVVVEDLRTEQRFSGPALLVDHDVVSGMSVIIGHSEPWGVFGVHTAEKRTFTQDDINFLQAVANCLAEAIQRKRTEEIVQASEERYRALFNDNPSMLFTVDRDGTVLSVNQSGAEQLGYTPEELIGRPVSEVFYDGDKEAARKYLDSCLLHGNSVHHWELRKIRKDGSMLWVREAARRIYDDEHNPRVFIVCEDISEAHRLSEQLSYHACHDPLTGLVNRREFEQRLLAILEAAREERSEHALCYLDLDQFKVINDTYGHFAGDQLLRQLSGLLGRQVRKRDTLARLGATSSAS